MIRSSWKFKLHRALEHKEFIYFICGVRHKYAPIGYNRAFQINSLNCYWRFLIHNGRGFIRWIPKEARLYYKLGQFVATRKPFFFFSKKKKR